MLWVLFTFPSRYLCAIGLGRVFSLGGWARRIHAGFHVPRATQGTAALRPASRTGLSPAAARLSRRFRSPRSCAPRGPTTPPGPESRRFGLLPGRSPLLGESLLFSLPPGTKMFQFPGFASPHRGDGSPPGCRVAPFRYPRINGRLRLPAAFRSLPRLSSPSRATGIRRAPFLAFARPAPFRAGRIPWNCLRQRPNGHGAAGFYSMLSSCSSMSMTERPRKGNCVWRITDSNR